MTDELWPDVDTKKARQRYLHATSLNRVVGPKPSLFQRIGRWPLANAFVIASLVVPPALFQFSQNAGATAAKVVAEVDCCSEVAPQPSSLETITWTESAVPATLATNVAAAAPAAVVVAPSPDLAEQPPVIQPASSAPAISTTSASESNLSPGTQGPAAADVLVVLYSTLSKDEALGYAADVAAIQANTSVVQTAKGYFGVVLGSYDMAEARSVRHSVMNSGLSSDAYLMNHKRVTRWVDG